MKKIWIALLALGLFAPAAAVAQGGKNWNTNSDNVVIDGYDVVAYFTEDRPVRGRADLSAEYDGVKFYFSSSENLEAFKKDPQKFAPKFGGFCAFGVAANKAKVPVDPHTFKVYNGELLLFFNDLYKGQPVNTKIMWNQNERKLYQDATTTWPTLK